MHQEVKRLKFKIHLTENKTSIMKKDLPHSTVAQYKAEKMYGFHIVCISCNKTSTPCQKPTWAKIILDFKVTV